MGATAQTRENSFFPSHGVGKAQDHVWMGAGLDFFRTPSCFAVWKRNFFFFPYLGAEQICYREDEIAMETVLILAVLQLMPTPRVQGWVRAQGSGEGEWPERVRTKAQSGQLITKPWEEAAEI